MMERRTVDKVSVRLVLGGVALLMPLQAATFAYALRIEHRLTALESALQIQSVGAKLVTPVNAQ